jgi:hypothetical protein
MFEVSRSVADSRLPAGLDGLSSTLNMYTRVIAQQPALW